MNTKREVINYSRKNNNNAKAKAIAASLSFFCLHVNSVEKMALRVMAVNFNSISIPHLYIGTLKWLKDIKAHDRQKTSNAKIRSQNSKRKRKKQHHNSPTVKAHLTRVNENRLQSRLHTYES